MAFLTIRFNSKTLNMATAVRIILPTGRAKGKGFDYDAYFAEKKDYPVLWLLHGGSDNYTDWHQNTNVEVLAEQYGYAVVMPDAQASSYANMAYGPRWRDYFIGELREYLYERFPLSRKREDNFIAGMSMGGFGSLKLALMNPERYSVCVPIASAVAIPLNYADGSIYVPGRASTFSDIFGFEDDPKKLLDTAENCYKLLKDNLEQGVTLPKIFMCCGLEDFTRQGNLDFIEYAKSLGVLINLYSEHGVHDWVSWNLYIPKVFEYIALVRKENK